MGRDVKTFFALLKKSQIEKKEFFYCKSTFELFSLVCILEKYGYIRFFTKKNKRLKIFLKLKKKHFLVRNITSKNSTKLNLCNRFSLANLKKKRPHCLFILKTRKGLLCDKKAFDLSCFGFVLAEVSAI